MEQQFSPMAQLLVEQYGPILRGADLRNAMGFDSSQSFLRAKRLGLLTVKVFSLPGRRGYFALTTDVAAWLDSCAKHSEIADNQVQVFEERNDQ